MGSSLAGTGEVFPPTRIVTLLLPNVTRRRLALKTRGSDPASRFWLGMRTFPPDAPATRHTLTRPVGRMRRGTFFGAGAGEALWRLSALALRLAAGVAAGVGVAALSPGESSQNLPMAKSAASST